MDNGWASLDFHFVSTLVSVVSVLPSKFSLLGTMVLVNASSHGGVALGLGLVYDGVILGRDAPVFGLQVHHLKVLHVGGQLVFDMVALPVDYLCVIQ